MNLGIYGSKLTPAQDFKVRELVSGISPDVIHCVSLPIIINTRTEKHESIEKVIEATDTIVVCTDTFQERYEKETWRILRLIKAKKKSAIIIWPDGSSRIGEGYGN